MTLTELNELMKKFEKELKKVDPNQRMLIYHKNATLSDLLRKNNLETAK